MRKGFSCACGFWIVLSAGCGSPDAEKQEDTDQAAEVRSSPTAGCLDVPADALSYINTALESDGVRVSRAMAVKSPQPYHSRDVYFISGEIDGRGYEGEGDVGTWAQPGMMGAYMMLAVDGLASTVSTFGTASNAPIRQPGYPGVQESIACLRGSSGSGESR